MSEIPGRIRAMYAAIGAAVAPPGSTLHCVMCGAERALSPDDAAHYTRHGWPRCCGRVMRVAQPHEREETDSYD